MIKVKVTGLSGVIRNLNKLLKTVDVGLDKALAESSVLIKEAAIPLTPIYTGNLRNSSYVVIAGKGEVSRHARAYAHATSREIANFERVRAMAIQGATARLGSSTRNKISEVGFGAEYALKVHEAVGTTFRVGGPKFLENTVQAIKPQIIGKIVSVIKL